MLVECGFILVDFVEDETPRLCWVEQHIETLATRFALKRSLRVGGNQIAKGLGHAISHGEANGEW